MTKIRKPERTIFEMMGDSNPPAAYSEGPPPVRFTPARGAGRVSFAPRHVEKARHSAGVAVWPVNEPVSVPEDPLRIGAGDDSLVRRLASLLPRFFSRGRGGRDGNAGLEA